MRARTWIPLLLLAACGGGDDTSTDPTTDAPAIDAPYDPSVIETRQVSIGVTGIGAGQEQTVCIIVDLGNSDARMIRAVRTQLTTGTHHVIATLSSSAPTPSVSPCGPFAGGMDNGVLTIGQQSESSLAYPVGSGVPIAAHQSIHLEMHYINTGDVPEDISGTVFLDLAAAGGNLKPVQFLFTGNPGFNIPAGQPLTINSTHPLPAGSQLFATTAHTHKLGLRATVSLDPPGTMLHESTNWAERPLDNFAPITIAEGQALHLTCNFLNTTGQDVGFGVSADDEMCFVWAHLVAP